MDKSNIKLLFVDDDITILKIIKTYFTRKNYDVLLAENGREGFNLAKKESPYVIVSDLMMPELDGYEFCKLVRKDEKLKNIPFIMLTAKESKENCIKGFQAGVNDYIIKPFNMFELYFKIQSFISIYSSYIDIKNKISLEKNMYNIKLNNFYNDFIDSIDKIKEHISKFVLNKDVDLVSKEDIIKSFNGINDMTDKLKILVNKFNQDLIEISEYDE